MATTPAAMMTNKAVAMKRSRDRVAATMRNKGCNKTRPNNTMAARATTACKNARPRLASTEPLGPAASNDTNISTGITARSCASSTAKLARPTLVVSRSWFESNSSTIAVDDSDRLAPTMIAADGFLSTYQTAPDSTAVVMSTCKPPRPNTSRRIVNSRCSDNSSPIRNNRNTMPSWAIPATSLASPTVIQ